MTSREVRLREAAVDPWSLVLFAGFLDSFAVVRTLSLVCRHFLQLSQEGVRLLDLHATKDAHTLLSRCVLPRYPHIGRLSIKWTSVSDVTLASLAQGLPNLTHLNLHGCTRITDNGCHSIALLTNLRFLDLSFCIGIGDLGLEHLRPLHLETLKLAMCRRVSDVGMAFLHHMHSLRELDLSCTGVTSHGLPLVAIANLLMLDVSGCRVDNASVASVLTAAPGLWYASVAHCELLTAQLWQLTKGSGLPALRVLVLRGARHLLALEGATERHARLWAVLFAKQCPHLAFLDIAACDVPPELKKKLVEAMPRLVVDDGAIDFPLTCDCPHLPPPTRRTRITRQARPH
ncbi:hypothetical protein ACHHYP_14590 [Achlya hypogyna]|uniref:Uncharacterized protein n=1 Tax=Achlya hypogyna TaxID=1202772 RepID=A0A1V9YCW1_ACHHY|nr:hypothetical protein ACHHYP_14590 [Achlya hypogyna]